MTMLIGDSAEDFINGENYIIPPYYLAKQHYKSHEYGFYDKRPIGIFDSGIGGLTVLKKINQLLPQEDLIYFGDLARLPYGTKSKEAVLQYSLQTVQFLIEQNVKMIVIACNTISAIAGEKLSIICRQYDVALVNIIDAMIYNLESYAEFLQVGNNISGRIPQSKFLNYLVLATPATISSGYYQNLLRKNVPLTGNIYAQSCELLVPIIEEGGLLYDAEGDFDIEGRAIVKSIVTRYLKPFFHDNIDIVILGCTHYPIIKELIQDVVQNNMQNATFTIDQEFDIIDPAESTAHKVKFVLRDLCGSLQVINIIETQESSKEFWGLRNLPDNNGQIKFYITDSRARFIKIASIFLNESISVISNSVELINLLS